MTPRRYSPWDSTGDRKYGDRNRLHEVEKMKEFKDRVAVVTGAASGIGRAIVDRCAEEGMKVARARDVRYLGGCLHILQEYAEKKTCENARHSGQIVGVSSGGKSGQAQTRFKPQRPALMSSLFSCSNQLISHRV